MKKNLKLLSGIIMASFISNCAIGSFNMDAANARSSRKVVVNSSREVVNTTDVAEAEDDTATLYSNLENGDKEVLDEVAEISTEGDDGEIVEKVAEGEVSDEITDEEVLYEEGTDEAIDGEIIEEEEFVEEEPAEGEQNIMEFLNSNEDLKIDDIVSLVKPVAYSLSFKDELNATFPDFEPLRELSPQINMEATQYVDVNENAIKDYVTFFSPYSNETNVYSEQNLSDILIRQISSNLTEINNEISEQKNSTIFSLLPTMIAFSDTLKILSTEYNSILIDNSDNKIRLNILLEDIEKQLSSLLAATNEFKNMLPESIEMLDELAGDSSSETTEGTEEEIVEEEITDDMTAEGEMVEGEVTDETTVDEEVVEGEIAEEEIVEEEIIEEAPVEEEVVVEEIVEEETAPTEETIDPKTIDLFFGSNGQELVFNKDEKKYYEQDPEDPEGLIEYTGEVKKMTLEEYLNIELFLDKDGRELIFDKDTNSYFAYNPETDEFSVYEGEVTKIKMKDFLEQTAE